MTKNAARREKFKKLGAALSKIGDPNAPHYYTGRDFAFEMKRYDSNDRLLHEVPLGPRFGTPQWERSLRA